MDLQLTRLCLFSLLLLIWRVVGNHTGRIKVVFTPTICKVTCTGGRCQNNCEQGNTTTIISENGHATDTLTAPNFRVVVCHLPCMNGGNCSARDKCQCPPNFTGKFCQLPVQSGQLPQQTAGIFNQGQVHSTHTLPLTYSNGQNHVQFSPSIVNIHVKHPPEASVQIHQVSQLDHNGQKVKGIQPGASSSSTSYSYHHTESSQTIQHQGHNIIYPGQHTYQPVTVKGQLGRCFQETTGSQCGKALPGLSKQEDCCNTIGTSWGFNKCQKCPKKPSIPLTGTRHTMDCPQGYKRINNSHCQDVNECQLQGACPNGDCLNTMGSYMCRCKPGFVPDPTLSACIPDTPAVQEEKGACFRLVSAGRQCLHPVSAQLSKQLCCCSVGKAWGPMCDKCPLPGTAKFKEICPGGMGYTVLPKPPINKPIITHQQPVATPPPLPLPTPEKPVEAFGGNEEEPPAVPEVVERTSPPAPVEIRPSNAGQDIAPTQSAEVDECQVNPHICGGGVCYNTAEGYTCHCDEGYQQDHAHTTCIDVDECADGSFVCHGGSCTNTPGSYLCVCPSGFMLDQVGTSCIDVDECQTPHVCPEGETCFNVQGSYHCRSCRSGFRLTPTGGCEDVDECEDMTVCPSGICYNRQGSYECGTCPDGFQGQGGQCVDIDECLDPETCANGKCTNVEGSFACACDEGFQLIYGESCQDVDECEDQSVCTRGVCQNTQGSFLCHCGPGLRASPAGDECDDVDECLEMARPCDSVGRCVNDMGSYHCSCPGGYQELNGTSCLDVNECLDDPELCGPNGECLNTEGSFQCVCERGFTAHPSRPNTCTDIDECADETLCGPNGYCENSMGSFRCLCDQGFQEPQDDHGCVDVNECEMLIAVCGEAQCENVEGTFLCLCPEGQEYNHRTAECSPVPTVPSVERKECYYRLNDENLCESVLTSQVTLEECCCTLGAGWGDNCEVRPCPVNGTDQFNQMCPFSRGFIPNGDAVYGVPTADSYKDADECALFGQEVCKGGFCLNTLGSYECYCKSGQDYDPTKMECRDINECLDESICGGGGCLNTDGSYMCFCTHPKVLDPVSNQCVLPPDVAEHREGETSMSLGICWETVTDGFTCTRPLDDRKTTYTECCCLYGEAWSGDCALCPFKHTEDYAVMCNVPMSGGRRPYGRDALVAAPVQEYEVGPDYMPRLDYASRPDSPAIVPLYEDEDDPYDAFEGLRAEECGVLNGCENGRCVRVQEGYTCDCFDGYTLDSSSMVCIDVNECSELNSRMSLCKNAKCHNTKGSYKCVCLPGFVPSEQPNYCVPRTQSIASAAAGTNRE